MDKVSWVLNRTQQGNMRATELAPCATAAIAQVRAIRLLHGDTKCSSMEHAWWVLSVLGGVGCSSGAQLGLTEGFPALAKSLHVLMAHTKKTTI
jgi:hypothetical protein